MCQFMQYMGGYGTGSAQSLLSQALSAGLRSQEPEPPWVKCPEPFPKAQTQKGCWSHLSLRGGKLAPSTSCHGTEHLLHLQHWQLWGKWYKNTHRLISNQRKAGFPETFHSDFSLLRNPAPYWFYSSLVQDRNVSLMYFTNSCRRCLLPDQLTLPRLPESSKKKENLQEDGPSAQELVCFHPKPVGHMKRTNIKETLLIIPTEIFISTGWHNFLSLSLSPLLRENKLP